MALSLLSPSLFPVTRTLINTVNHNNTLAGLQCGRRWLRCKMPEEMSQVILRYLSIWGPDTAYLISLPADLRVYGPYLGSVQFCSTVISIIQKEN